MNLSYVICLNHSEFPNSCHHGLFLIRIIILPFMIQIANLASFHNDTIMPWKYFLHGTICRYSCAFLSLCKFQTGNPSRRFASHRFAAMRYVFSHLGTLVESSHGAASPMRYSRGRYSLFRRFGTS